MNYQDFIEQKRIKVQASGFDVEAGQLNDMLFDWQKDIVQWTLYRGRSAIFLDCGLGKSPLQLEFAKHVVNHTRGDVLILAPLAVSAQTQREGIKFGIDVNVAKTAKDLKSGINVTNYDRLHHFEGCEFAGLVLDESSILKGEFGQLRNDITDYAGHIPYLLSATATPAPNDFTELLRQAEYLGVMLEKESKALFFTQDGNSSNKFRLKRHAELDFWKWVSEWAIAMRKPSDLGYDDGAFVLPPLTMHEHVAHTPNYQQNTLFAMEATTLSEQRDANKYSLENRVQICADMVNASDEPWIVWCNLNYESEALRKAIPDAVEVKGSDKDEFKEDAMIGFADGRYRVLITKPSIAGFGMNWQHCANAAFVGLSHSYEQFYQAIRRNWRFGQKFEVNAHVIISEADGAVVRNIERKEQQSERLFDEIIKHMTPHARIKGEMTRNEMAYDPQLKMIMPQWVMSYPDSESDEAGWFLYPFDGYVVGENFNRVLVADGSVDQPMNLPEWMS